MADSYSDLTTETNPYMHYGVEGHPEVPTWKGVDDRGWMVQLKGFRSREQDLKDKLSALSALMENLTGPENWVNRFLVGLEINQTQASLSRLGDMQAQASARRHLEWATQEQAAYEAGIRKEDPNYEAYVRAQEQNLGRMLTEEEKEAFRYEPLRPPPESPEYWARVLEEAKGQTTPSGARPSGLPIPDWMNEFIIGETTFAPEKRRGMSEDVYRAKTRGEETGMPTLSPGGVTGGLRPIGAQAELTTEQLKQLSGFLGWYKGGRPSRYGGGYAGRLGEGWGDWWNEYVKLSESLFPSKYAPNTFWKPAKQR